MKTSKMIMNEHICHRRRIKIRRSRWEKDRGKKQHTAAAVGDEDEAADDGGGGAEASKAACVVRAVFLPPN